ELSVFSLFLFFFQAEDGIRDFHVTGVQTCALPIFLRLRGARDLPRGHRRQRRRLCAGGRRDLPRVGRRDLPRRRSCGRGGPGIRSEERRVGKECRWWWAPDGWNREGERRWQRETER